MSAATDELTWLDIVQDDAPECQVAECESKAEWEGLFRCCGNVSKLCDPCKRRMQGDIERVVFDCQVSGAAPPRGRRCGRPFRGVVWTRLP